MISLFAKRTSTKQFLLIIFFLILTFTGRSDAQNNRNGSFSKKSANSQISSAEKKIKDAEYKDAQKISNKEITDAIRVISKAKKHFEKREYERAGLLGLLAEIRAEEALFIIDKQIKEQSVLKTSAKYEIDRAQTQINEANKTIDAPIIDECQKILDEAKEYFEQKDFEKAYDKAISSVSRLKLYLQKTNVKDANKYLPAGVSNPPQLKLSNDYDDIVTIDPSKLKIAPLDEEQTKQLLREFNPTPVQKEVDNFANVKNRVKRNRAPAVHEIPIEDFVNRFDYNYPAPENATLSVTVEGSEDLSGQNQYLFSVGINSKDVSKKSDRKAKVTIILDVSSRMDREDRLSFIRSCLKDLASSLGNGDEIAIIAFGEESELLLRHTGNDDLKKINLVINSISGKPGRNTKNALYTGFEYAASNFDPKKNNRLIFCSSGGIGSGDYDRENIHEHAKRFSENGIVTSSVGFLIRKDDSIQLEKIADHNGGNFEIINSKSKWEQFFQEELTGIKTVVANDIQIIVDVNDEIVIDFYRFGNKLEKIEHKDTSRYYYHRELLSSEQITAVYKVTLRPDLKGEDIAEIKIKYKEPGSDEESEIVTMLNLSDIEKTYSKNSKDFQLAVSSVLYFDYLSRKMESYNSVITSTSSLAKLYPGDEKVEEFVELVHETGKVLKK